MACGARVADALLGVEGIHVSAVTETASGLVLHVETGGDLAGCPDCGLVAVGHGRRQVRLHSVSTPLSLPLAHQLGISWHTAWDAMKAEATHRLSATSPLDRGERARCG